MYTNGINNYNTVREDTSKPQMSNQNFDFDGEAFSDLMDKEKPAGKGLRESAQELAEDEAILSTDEENRAMIKKPANNVNQTPKPHFAGEEDKARLLKLMDMSNKINMTVNISKSKKELENTVGPSLEDDTEPEDISAVIAKMMADKENDDSNIENDDVETSINMNKHPEDFEDKKQDNSQILHETEEELKEDMSILSTEEENLEMARRNSAMNKLSDDDYKTTQDDMIFLNDIVALNNQVHVEQSDRLKNTQNVLSALMKQTQSIDNYNRIDMSELKSEDVDFIIGLLRMGTADSSNYTDKNNDELNILSEKFLALLRDSIINHKVFRIDFDNKISVIIKIDVEGKVHAEFQTTDEATETYLKNHLHILKEKFEELNVSYGEITYKNTNK